MSGAQPVKITPQIKLKERVAQVGADPDQSSRPPVLIQHRGPLPERGDTLTHLPTLYDKLGFSDEAKSSE